MINLISVAVMPVMMILIIGYGLYKKVNVFDCFIEGAADGLKITVKILPALIGLISAITMFRVSGAMRFITDILSPVTSLLHIPGEILPLALLRPVSGSGSLAIVNDLLTTHGPDSLIGRIASVMMGSTETTFYTVAVYYGSVGIKNTRHTIKAALFADLTGILASVWLCIYFFEAIG